MLDLDTVGQHLISLGIEPKGHSDRSLLGADQGKRACILDQLGQALDTALAVSSGYEFAQTADDLAGPQRLLGRLADCFA